MLQMKVLKRLVTTVRLPVFKYVCFALLCNFVWPNNLGSHKKVYNRCPYELEYVLSKGADKTIIKPLSKYLNFNKINISLVPLTIFLERSPNLVVQPISVVSQWYLFECLFGPFLWSAGRRDIFVVGYLTYMIKIIL